MPRVTLVRCGRCGKPRGPRHECTSSRRGPAYRFKPGLSFTCSKCGKQVPNLLTHTCTVRTDFARRKAAAARREKTDERRRKRKAATARRRARKRERQRQAAEQRKQARAQQAEARRNAARPQSHNRHRHDFETCAEPKCPAFPCAVYRKGKLAGHAEGEAEGHGKGYVEGYANGYRDGIDACPRSHN